MNAPLAWLGSVVNLIEPSEVKILCPTFWRWALGLPKFAGVIAGLDVMALTDIKAGSPF
jgi:hypothetical protein